MVRRGSDDDYVGGSCSRDDTEERVHRCDFHVVAAMMITDLRETAVAWDIVELRSASFAPFYTNLTLPYPLYAYPK